MIRGREVFMKDVSVSARCYSRVFLFLLFCVFLLAAGAIFGQEVTANVTGVVTDPSGAAIAGVKVTATDTQRGTQYSGETNNDGRYRISNLLVGSYDVKAEGKGFQTATVSNLTLQLNQTAKLDFPMQVGNLATSIEVTSEAPLLQTESTQLGQVIDARTNTT